MNKSLLIVLLSALFFIGTVSTGARANEQKDPNIEVIELGDDLVYRDLGISILRSPEILSEQFIIRLSAQDKQISGCSGKVSFSHESKFTDVFLDIMIKEIVKDKSNMPKNPHYECGSMLQESKMDIIVSRYELKKNNIKYIRIKNGPWLDFFEIKLDDNYVELIHAEDMSARQVFEAQKRAGVKDTLKTWFYPENTYILYPQTKPSSEQDFEEKLKGLARRKGLTPLKSVMNEFETPLSREHHYYYVDEKGDFSKSLGEAQGGFLDNIYVETMSYKLEGDVSSLQPLAVYARKPVIYE
jgi:hypothetical protein